MKKSIFLIGSLITFYRVAAQEKDSIGQNRLDEVIVTASRSPEIVKRPLLRYILSTKRNSRTIVDFAGSQ